MYAHILLIPIVVQLGIFLRLSFFVQLAWQLAPNDKRKPFVAHLSFICVALMPVATFSEAQKPNPSPRREIHVTFMILG